MATKADYPFLLPRGELREAIDAAYADPGFAGWRIAKPSLTDADDGGRRRRLGVVFALGLPGPVTIDADAEVTFHGNRTAGRTEAPTVVGWAEMLGEMLRHRESFKLDEQRKQVPWCRQANEDWDERPPSAARGPGILSYDVQLTPVFWGWQVIANFGEETACLFEGSISVASSDPNGGRFNSISDNDDLPGEVAVWFHCK